MPNGIRIRSAVFPQCTGQTDGRTHGQTDRPTDGPRESLTTIGRYATTATRPKNKIYRVRASYFAAPLYLELRGNYSVCTGLLCCDNKHSLNQEQHKRTLQWNECVRVEDELAREGAMRESHADCIRHDTSVQSVDMPHS